MAFHPRRFLAAAQHSKPSMAALVGGNPLVAGVMNERLQNLAGAFAKQVNQQLGYCIRSTDNEWNSAFNFSADPTFLTDCMKTYDGDLPQRVCTAAEMKFYFESFKSGTNFIRPNKNCNLTSWNDGCEPGWACSVGEDEKVDLQNSTFIPSRTLDCRACCHGFFCPRGITCMIPCPLEAYCPHATLNNATGICHPYNYQPPPGKPNHTCGGADKWADVISTDDVFCPAGFYCPSTIRKFDCPRGYFCRKGSTYKTTWV